MDRVDEILAAETPAFARAVRAIITGDVAALRAELAAVPDLIHARSASSHRSTLLHYVAANGIEDPLQRPVANADDIARMLIAAGASVDAPCNAYDGRYPTTLSLLVSSDHPAAAACRPGSCTCCAMPAQRSTASAAIASRCPPPCCSARSSAWTP